MTAPTAGSTPPFPSASGISADETLRRGIEGWVADPLAKKLMLAAVNHIEQAEAALAEALRIMRDPNAHGGCDQMEDFHWDEETDAFLRAHPAPQGEVEG